MSRATPLVIPLLAAIVAGGQAQAQTAAGDRYGAAPSPDPATAVAVSPAFAGRMLAWPGKQAASAVPSAANGAAPQAYSPRPYPEAYPAQRTRYASAPSLRWGQPSVAAVASGADPQSTGRYGAAAYSGRPAAIPASYAPASRADDGWRPVFAAPAPSGDRQPQPVLAGAPSPAPLPSSIYSPPATSGTAAATLSPAARAAALPPPVRGSAAQRYGYDPTQDHAVRFYSVHRAFGLQPDPAPIPPQFFTATADLANPPGPLTTERTTTTSSGSTTHAVRATPDAGTD